MTSIKLKQNVTVTSLATWELAIIEKGKPGQTVSMEARENINIDLNNLNT